MFSTANYIPPEKYKHNIDQHVFVMCHLPKPVQDCMRPPLYHRSAILKVSYPKYFQHSMRNIFKNILKINIRLMPHAKVSVNMIS